MRLRESWQTFPGFQDRVRIKTQDPHFSRNHSIHLITYSDQVMNFFLLLLIVNMINLSLSATKWTFSEPMLFSFKKCQCWLWINGNSAIIIVYWFIDLCNFFHHQNIFQFVFLLPKNRAIFNLNPGTTDLKLKEKLSDFK